MDAQIDEALAANVLESTPDCYLAVDRDWRLVLVNKASEEFWVLSRREVLGRSIWEIFPHLPGTRFESAYRAVMNDRVPRDFSMPSVMRAGFYVRVRVFPCGEGIALRFRDITPEHEVEAQHRRALAELEAIYKFAPIGLALLDTELRYLKINDALAEMNGVAPEDHLGRTIEEVAPGVSDEIRPLFRAVFEDNTPIVGIEITGETRKTPGVRGAWLENISPVLIEDGRVRAALVAVMEITTLKHTEERLAQSLRLQKLLHRELVHRVANNFQVVSSMLHLQGRRAEMPGVADALNTAADRIQAMGIIHRKLYANQPELAAPELVSYLRELCDDLASIYAGVPDHPELVFRGEGEIRLSFDRSIMVAMIVAELVTNAFKYAYPQGNDGEIIVSIERVGDTELELSVRDYGRGLPEGLDPRSSKGLGMLVARSNARQLGSELEVDRTPPGVCFRLKLVISEQ
jgi:PAS domain S-box-containing protein